MSQLMSQYTHALTPDEIHALIQDVFPLANQLVKIVAFEDGTLDAALQANDQFLRPGGTISGPTMMLLADTAFYYLVLGLIGPQPLAVTTQLNINFLRKPPPGTLYARARMLKLGARLAVGDVILSGEGDPERAVAHAQLTYSIPPRGRA